MPDPEQIITAIEREAGVYQMLWNPKLCASAASGAVQQPGARRSGVAGVA